MDGKLLGEIAFTTATGDTVEFEPREKAILAYFLIVAQPNAVVTRERLMKWLWDSAAGKKETLYNYIAKLRNKLTKKFGGAVTLEKRSQGLALRIPDPLMIDYHRFNRSFTTAKVAMSQGNHELALTEVKSALTEWRGEPLTGLGYTTTAIENQRTALRNEWKAACLLHAKALMKLDRLADALTEIGQSSIRWPNDHEIETLRAELLAVRPPTPTRFAAAGDASNMVEQAPAPFMAPPLPAQFVERPEGRQLLSSLVAAANIDGAALGLVSTAGLHGTGGYGKTTLAAWACGQPEVRERFPDGVLWVDLGRDATDQKIIAVLRDLITLLTGKVPAQFATVAAAADRFTATLGQRRVLLVVDDVWRRSDLDPFLRGGSRSVRLIITRLPNLLPPTTNNIRLDKMGGLEAMALLRAGLPASDNAVFMPLLERSGRWPLALRLLNTLLRSVTTPGADLSRIITEIAAELDRRGPELLDDYPEPEMRTAAATLAMSLDAITDHPDHGPRSVERFITLAAFPEEMHVPFRQLELLWSTSMLDVLRQCAFLADHSLLALRDDHGVRLHDVVRDLLRHRWSTAIQAASLRLVEAERALCTEGWHTLPDDDARFLDTLTHHLVQSKCSDEVHTVTTDLRFLVERVWRSGPSALATEVLHRDLAGCSEMFTRGIADVVRSEAHLLVDRHNREELAATLFSRCHGRVATRTSIHYTNDLLRGAFLPLFPFPDMPDPRLDRILTGRSSPVTTVRWRGDGRVLAAGDDLGTIYLYRIDNEMPQLGDRGPMTEVAAAEDPVTSLSWSSDLLLLAAGTERGELIVIDPEDASVLFRLGINGADKAAVCFAPDSSTVVVASSNGAMVVRVDDPTNIVMMPYMGTGCVAADWHTTRGLAVLLSDGRVVTWSGKNAHENPVVIGRTNAGASGTPAWHPNGAMVAVASSSGQVTLLSTEPGGKTTRVDTGTSWIRAVTWMSGGDLLLTGNQDGVVQVWSVTDHDGASGDLAIELTETLPGRAMLVLDLASDNRTGLLAVAQGKPSIRVWKILGDLSQHGSVRPWRPPGRGYDSAGGFWERANVVRWAPDGSMVAVGNAAGELLLIAPDGARATRTRDPEEKVLTPPAWFEWSASSLAASRSELRSVAWAPDSLRLLTVDDAGSVSLWDLDSTEPAPTQILVQDPIWQSGQVAWSPNGQIAAAGGRNAVLLWRTDSWLQIGSLQPPGRVGGLAFSPDGDELAVAIGSELHVTSVRHNAVRAFEGHQNGVSAVRWSRDGNFLISGGLDSRILVWSPSGHIRHVLDGDGSAVLDVDISADGKFAVAVTMTGSVLCWNVVTGRRTSGLLVDSPLLSCSFAPTPNRVVLGGAAGLYVCSRESLRAACEGST